MKITRFETLMANAGLRNYLFIRLHTDIGVTGIGEASLEWQEKTVQTVAHEWVEGRILGRDPFDIERVVGDMIRDQYQGGSTVMDGLAVVAKPSYENSERFVPAFIAVSFCSPFHS